MELKKTPQADIEQLRTTGLLMGLVVVLALLYVALEWNSVATEEQIDPIDLSDIMHENELVPMSNEEVMVHLEEKKDPEQAERLNVVDDEVETAAEEVMQADADEQLLADLQEEDDKPLQALDADPDNPLNFHIVEDLPKFPGGAVEFMKWLTKNLQYPPAARAKRIQGKVTAVFYIEKDGTVTGIAISKSLSPECDSETLRVLKKMPKWEPGIQNDQPCRTKVSIPVVFKL